MTDKSVRARDALKELAAEEIRSSNYETASRIIGLLDNARAYTLQRLFELMHGEAGE